MKHLKQLLTAALAMLLALVVATPAWAEDTGKITITVPSTEQAPTQPVTYKVYKVFDATVDATDNTKVNYTLCEGDTLTAAMTAAGFSVDGQGNVSGPTTLNQAAIDAIAAYVTEGDLVDSPVAAVGDTSVDTAELPYGYYYITTTTGTAVTIDSNNNNPTVEDKNVIPKVKKSAGTQYDAASLKAIAAVGTDQDFSAEITKTKGATNLVFTDTMTNMTYNSDLEVTVNGSTVAPTSGDTKTYTVTGAEGASSFTVTFDNDYIAGLADGTVIALSYSGKITSDALSTNPATNKAELTSGDGNKSESDTINVYNAKISVNKVDGDNQPLAGAKFKLKNAENKYYAGSSSDGTANWTDEGVEVEAVSVSGAYTAVFKGLGAGTYTLEESTVPKGYNKAADQTITITDNDFTAANLEQVKKVTNNSGTELPSTGGMGTTILYIVGGIMVAGAIVVLITKKRVNSIEK